MVLKHKQIQHLFRFVAQLFVIGWLVSGCGGASLQQSPPTLALVVSPGTKVSQGESVAIVAEVEPLEKLDLEWSVSGTAGGTLNAYTGEQVVYTAGQAGVDIVVAEGTTTGGAPVKEIVSLTVSKETNSGTSVAGSVAQHPSIDTPMPTLVLPDNPTPVREPASSNSPTAIPMPTAPPANTPIPTLAASPTITPTSTVVKITGILCRVDQLDTAPFAIWLPRTLVDAHFGPLGSTTPFSARVRPVHPETGDLIGQWVTVRVDSYEHSQGMKNWETCDLSMKRDVRQALCGGDPACDMDNIAQRSVDEKKDDRTLDRTLWFALENDP